MKSSTILSIIVIIIILAGGWYLYMQQAAPTPAGSAGINGSQDQGNVGGTDTGTVQQPGADGAEGMIIGSNLALGTDGNQTFGPYLIAYNGMTVYTFDKDKVGTTTCYGDCAVKWPPYLVGAEDNVNQLKAGVTGKADTIIRADGGIQMTYNGLPLYFYVSDTASGDVKGDGVGGVWHVVKP
jgi:predicted lipoprotein with Yx(FWY)xxD motif